jgi:hypothetical protein
MDPIGEDKITRLLRLKRYEKPPPGYFENFIHEFHRRQNESLREPFWSICVERVRDFVFRCNIRTLAAYSAGVVTAAACVAVIFLSVYQQPQTRTQVAVPILGQFQPRYRLFARELQVAPWRFARTFDIRSTLLPGIREVPAVTARSLRSDESVALNLEWESIDEESLLPK